MKLRTAKRLKAARVLTHYCFNCEHWLYEHFAGQCPFAPSHFRGVTYRHARVVVSKLDHEDVAAMGVCLQILKQRAYAASRA